jgi:alpha-L-arabinofuranosidase
MASGKVSKNSTKGSKPTKFEKPIKEKKVKEYILVEITAKVKDEIKHIQDLSEYHGKEIVDIERRYGKSYFKIKPDIKVNGTALSDVKNNLEMSFDEFEIWVEGQLKDVELKAAKAAEGNNPAVLAGTCEISGSVWLDPLADNCYQDVTAAISITIDARQVNGEYATQ